MEDFAVDGFAHGDRSALRAGAAAGAQFHRAVGNSQAERRADGAFDQADLAAMGAHQFGGDGKAKPGAAGAGRALERLEQMRAAPCRKSPARYRTPRSPPLRLRAGR